MVLFLFLFSLIKSLASIISTNLSVKFPLSSFNPFFHPANENAWQGVPPHIKSESSTSPLSIKFGILFISPKFGISGYFVFNTCEGKSAISENQLNL